MHLLSSLFPSYKVTRAKSWLKNYAPEELKTVDGEEWVTDKGFALCAADINREDPNRIQLEVVYARVLESCGIESAELFKKELLCMRRREKERKSRQARIN